MLQFPDLWFTLPKERQSLKKKKMREESTIYSVFMVQLQACMLQEHFILLNVCFEFNMWCETSYGLYTIVYGGI